MEPTVSKGTIKMPTSIPCTEGNQRQSSPVDNHIDVYDEFRTVVFTDKKSFNNSNKVISLAFNLVRKDTQKYIHCSL